MKFTNENAISLLTWYQKNKRDLPWRDTNNAYDVWLSEIMLQQTRVEAVKEKFLLFKKELPTINDLANVDDDYLMKLWEGLGYYNRARNLKKCAIVLVEQYNSQLPSDYKTLLTLPGIGPYTAGAISSIAYNQPIAAVDGNVLRILARLFNMHDDIRDPHTRTIFENILNTYTDSNKDFLLNYDPHAFSNLSQSLMELGALVCVPNGKPNCEACCWRNECISHLKNTTDSIPYRSPLKKRKIVNRTLFILCDETRFYLQKRPASGLLANLYEFYGIDEHLTKQEILKHIEDMNLKPINLAKLPNSKHIFSHIEWHMRAYEIKVSNLDDINLENGLLLTRTQLQDFAIPSAFKAIKDYYKF